MSKRNGSSDNFSGGQHPASKRQALFTSKVEAKSSVSSHSAGDFSLHLLDENNFELELQEHELAYDPRPPLDALELEDILLEKNADVIIEVESVARSRIDWNVTCREPWHVNSKSTFSLCNRHPVTTIMLRRLTSCSANVKQINFMLMKTLKGKVNGSGEFFRSRQDWQDLAFAIFDFLLASAPLTYVIGNIGLALPSIIVFSKVYQEKVGDDMLRNHKFLTTGDQMLSCIYLKAAEKRLQPLLDMSATLPTRIFSMVMEAVPDLPQKASNSSGSHLVVGSADATCC